MDNPAKGFSFERGTANQNSVNVFLFHENVDILRLNRATIQYSYLAGNVFLVEFAEEIPNKNMGLLGLTLAGRLAGADCPNRFIGYDRLPGADRLRRAVQSKGVSDCERSCRQS